jgi:hypothetical protein
MGSGWAGRDVMNGVVPPDAAIIAASIGEIEGGTTP